MKRHVVKYAKKYTSRGWRVVPVPYKQKGPHLKGWQKLRLEQTEIAEFFTEEINIGVLLGKPSGGRVDVDLDCPEAVVLAPIFLPATRRIHGRRSKPHSHRWYRAQPIPSPEKFCDLGGTCLLELRSTGQQTIVPPSVHPSGERVRWERKGRCARVDGRELRTTVRTTAAAVLIVRHWPKKGSRNDAARALAGMLLRARWSEAETEKFIAGIALAAGDEESRKRVRNVISTVKRLDAGGTATGAPSLAAILGKDVVARIREWLGIGPSDFSEVGVRVEKAKWPAPLSERAYHGLAGKFVHTVAPETEADSAALLTLFLLAFGNAVGRGPYFEVGAVRHHTNLFCTLVGDTAKSRKGTAWAEVVRLFRDADPEWTGRVQSGLVSGEGVIWHVRDAVEKLKWNKKQKRMGTVIKDKGVADKRLTVLEAEFASALRVIRREGNTLSAVMRDAWDRGDLSTLAKNSPVRVTGAHISWIGQITRDELLYEFSANEGSNGFANRFLWVCARRSRELPFGGQVDRGKLAGLSAELSTALKFARAGRKIRFSKQARELWAKKYHNLSAGRPGLLGAIVSRAEPQVLRLAMAYPLLDCSSLLTRRHLRAALAVWKYCEDSARYIFGDKFGNPVVDRILARLRKNRNGLTRTEIREIFSRNRSESEISNALRVLVEYGLARCVRKETGGRPSKRWFAVR